MGSSDLETTFFRGVNIGHPVCLQLLVGVDLFPGVLSNLLKLVKLVCLCCTRGRSYVVLHETALRASEQLTIIQDKMMNQEENQ